MRAFPSFLALILIFAVAISCRLTETLTGDKNAGTVSSLWSDVPPLPGAVKSDMEIPLGARLAIRAMMQGKVNFIAFKTKQTAQEVKDFYSNDRMKTAGWTPNDKGCVGDTEDQTSHGAVCLFERKDAGKDEGLAIVLGQDEKTKETDVFYARIDMTKTK
ncbi:MAG TPA: hypothetical protein VKB46_28390 [Pyrinomonadaceae bacterium]|nr:hypothetical protein [Pyrinomonadaceae bacterium]